MTPELLTVAQAGQMLGLARTQACELASRGILPAFYTPYHRGRMVRRADVLALAEKWAAEATANTTILTATTHERPRTITNKRARK